MITLSVDNQQLSISSVPSLLIEGTRNFIPIEVELDNIWKEFEVVVEFIQNQNGEEKVYSIILPETRIIYLPTEIKSGSCRIYLYGTKDSEIIATTSGVSLTLNEFGGVIGAEIIDATPDLYAQFVAQFQEGLNEIQSKYDLIEGSLINKVESSDFEQLQENFSTFSTEAENRIAANESDIDNVQYSLTELSENYNTFVENTDNSINTINSSIDTINNFIDSNIEDINEIQNNLIEITDEHKAADWITETNDAVVLEDSIRSQITGLTEITLIKNQKTFENILYVRLHFNVVGNETEAFTVNGNGYIKLGDLREDIQIPSFSTLRYFAVKYVPAYYETLDASVRDANGQPTKRRHSGLVQFGRERNSKLGLYFLKDDSLLDTEVISRIEFTVTFQSLAIETSSSESNEEGEE